MSSFSHINVLCTTIYRICQLTNKKNRTIDWESGFLTLTNHHIVTCTLYSFGGICELYLFMKVADKKKLSQYFLEKVMVRSR